MVLSFFLFFFVDVTANCDATNALGTRVVITENGVRLRLNIVDTPGMVTRSTMRTGKCRLGVFFSESVPT